MKWLLCAAGLLALCGALSGCAGLYVSPVQPGVGILFTEVEAPLDPSVDPTVVMEKRGEAMATNVLGWVVTGDASIAAAAREGGITKVHHMDYHYKNILGVYATFTTIVYGE